MGWPPPTFSPVIWGAQQGFLIGLLFGAGVDMLALSRLYFASWRPRMTTRRWMIAVVIIGCVMGGIQIERRREYLVDCADWHRIIAYAWEARRAAAPNDPNAPRFIAYFESLASKYRHAARYPWLAVEPEPPEPE